MNKGAQDLTTQYLRSQDAAEVLGYSVQHTRLLIRQGKLKAQKLGRDWLVVRESVAEYQTLLAFCDQQQQRRPTRADRIVNVASVPMRSPFRYPGGKTWLVPRIRQWLRSRSKPFRELIEPFAGGGIIGLTSVFEDLVERASLVELDEDVAAVWRTVLNGNGEWLANRIAEFELTRENIKGVLKRASVSLRQRAFATIIRNRINRGGILAPGAGTVKKGENGRGLHSRWYPETLRRRILDIVQIKNRLAFLQGDGITVLRQRADEEDLAFFIDPPYTIAGRRLYKYAEIDHEALFDAANSVTGDFLMTYDDATEILKLAETHGFQVRKVPMKNTHHDKKMELVIGRDLSWLSE